MGSDMGIILVDDKKKKGGNTMTRARIIMDLFERDAERSVVLTPGVPQDVRIALQGRIDVGHGLVPARMG